MVLLELKCVLHIERKNTSSRCFMRCGSIQRSIGPSPIEYSRGQLENVLEAYISRIDRKPRCEALRASLVTEGLDGLNSLLVVDMTLTT
jgi:hypothetical protein